MPGPEGGRKRSEFEATLGQSIEDGLREVLGESGLQMVLSHHPLTRLSNDPDALHRVLEGIFKEGGAAIIEREISRRLLDNVGSDQARVGRLQRLWLAAKAPGANGPGRASQSEKKVLRQFVALAALPSDHPSGGTHAEASRTSRGRSLELASLNFAVAFKKGS